MALGATMTAAGALGLAYMALVNTQPVKALFWLVPITVLSVGIAILKDDLSDSGKR